MKFYENVLKDKTMSAGEKILYCYYISRSVVGEELNYATGGFEIDEELYKDGFTEYVPTPVWKVARDLRIDRRQVRRVHQSLERKELVPGISETGWRIRIRGDTLHPFFSAVEDCGLSGYDWIVYSYLKNASAQYGIIDKRHESLAEKFGIHPVTLSNILSRLEAKGLIRRIRRPHTQFNDVEVI